MTTLKAALATLLVAASFCSFVPDSLAHGGAGKRVFPATLLIEDPDVADELKFPAIRRFKETEHGSTAAHTTEISAEYAKRITENFGIIIEGAYIDQSNAAGGQTGFENIGVGAKYKVFSNDEHEVIFSAGLEADLGGTGDFDVGAESFSTITPHIFFGKGFGDLPDTAAMLRPLALTASAGLHLPTRRYSHILDEDTGEIEREGHPVDMHYGLTLQYSLPYLQQHVKNTELKAPFINLVPVVEMEFSTPLARAHHTTTTGTINPGVIWSGHGVQIGLEAVVPINGESGKGVGFMAQASFALDDIFPDTLGKPLFGH